MLYGFQGPRQALIRWELALLIAYEACMWIIPGLLVSVNPIFVWQMGALEVIFYLGALLLPLWIIAMSGDDLSVFGLTKPTLKDWSVVPVFAALPYLGACIASRMAEAQPLTLPLPPVTVTVFLSNFALLLIPAFLEEVVCRGLLQSRISEVLNSRWFGLFGAAIVFTLCHVAYGYGNLQSVFIFAVIVGFARMKGTSILTLTIGHALYNANLRVAWEVFF